MGPVRAFLRRSLVRVSVHGVLRGEENVDDRNRGSRLKRQQRLREQEQATPVPFGELGSVDQSKTACGLFQIGGDSIGRLSPGWGGLKELPEMLEILATLKHRQQQRGDQGQIQRTENLERKIDAIIQHFRIKLPDDLDIDEAPGAISMKR